MWKPLKSGVTTPFFGRHCRPMWAAAGNRNPAAFSCLIFDPSKMSENCLVALLNSPFQPRSKIVPNGRFSFWAGVFFVSLCSSAHRRSVGDTRGCAVVIYSLFSVVVVPGFCYMCFLLDRKLWHYPQGRIYSTPKGLPRSRDCLSSFRPHGAAESFSPNRVTRDSQWLSLLFSYPYRTPLRWLSVKESRSRPCWRYAGVDSNTRWSLSALAPNQICGWEP